MNNINSNENETLVDKLVGLVEKFNERVLTLEKKWRTQNESRLVNQIIVEKINYMKNWLDLYIVPSD